MSEIAQTDNFNDKTNIKVVGVGGAGGNAVNRMIAEGLQSVEFIAINTDAKDLMRSDADVKISLNDATSRGLGAGADPEKGAKAAQDHQSDIEESLKGADMVFVTCGEGGGTGTGASPIVARAAHQQGALTIAVVTRPFSFEGPQRAASAALGIENLRKEFRNLKKITTDTESKLWLDSLLRNIDTLENRVDDLVQNIHVGGTYDSNIKELDDNIYILTELIQDDIQYYIYYQTESMEKVTDTLNTQIRTFIIICACLIAVLAIGLVMAVMQITTGMLRPIQVLAQAAGRISKGDLDARADVDSRDEIAVLADRFNDMAGNIQTLVVKVREDEQKMRKADLRLLQEQINPHFLYNTLDNIVWLIEGNEPDEAVEMVVTLSEFFRLVLSKGKEFITIRQEEQHISSYLQIQEKRYHDILDYHIYIDPEIYEYQIPKLTLQPLVENALYHGIKYKRSRGMIEITGTKEGENLYLTVADDGVGMDEDELKKLGKEISRPCKETESGFGLANVNERIRMYFGAEFGMKIWSEKGSGTRITIEIPAITDNPEKPEAGKQSTRSEEAENEAEK